VRHRGGAFEVRIGRIGFGHMRRDDGRPGWFSHRDGAYAPIGPGSTGTFWKAIGWLLGRCRISGGGETL
jgi:hypothetical protein